MISAEELRDLLDNAMSEATLQAWVQARAKEFGWKYYHTRDSRGSDPGYLDVHVVKAPRNIHAELKRQDAKKGKVTEAQQEWIDELRGCPGVEVYVWRPSDMDEILAVLSEATHEKLDGSS